MSRGNCPLLCCGPLLLAILGGPAPLAAQQPVLRGQVLEQGSGAAVEGALVSLYDGTVTQVASVLSDSVGSFTLSAPGPGAYTLQASAGGLLSTMVQIEADSRAASEEAVLVMPSRLALLASECSDLERTAGTGILVGTVRDASSGVPLPGASVVLRWGEGEEGGEARTEADGGGRYRFCTAPAGTDLTIGASFLQRVRPAGPVPMPRPALVQHDLVVPAVSTTGMEVAEVRRAGPADGPGSLVGTLNDAVSGAAVSGAILTLLGQRTQQRLSDPAGAFQFENLTPGAYLLEVQRLGYGVQRQPVEVPGSSDVRVTLKLAATALELEGIQVTARTPAEERARAAPGARYVVTEPDIEAMENRGTRLIDLVRTRIPGLRVQQGVFWTVDSSPEPMLCIESSRGRSFLSITADRQYSEPFCDMVLVYIDGVRIAGAGSMLYGIQLTAFQQVEYLSSVEAGALYGLGAQSGVLLLTTKRGRPGSPD